MTSFSQPSSSSPEEKPAPVRPKRKRVIPSQAPTVVPIRSVPKRRRTKGEVVVGEIFPIEQVKPSDIQ